MARKKKKYRPIYRAGRKLYGIVAEVGSSVHRVSQKIIK